MKLVRLFFVGAFGVVAACVGDSSVDSDGGGNDATTDGGGTNDVANDTATGCAARTADDATGVFVAQSGADVNSCGTRANPCKTITYAIATAKAVQSKTTLYVGSGTYQESVTLDTALTIEGGWSATGGTWTPVCDSTTSTAVTIEGVTNTTVSESFTGSATLRDLKVISKPAADPGESLYGISATGASTTLTLDQVVVVVAAGGNGGGGVDGTAATSAAVDAGCATGTGATGATGPSGTGAADGTFTSTGFVTTSGGDAGVGGLGNNGTAGGTGATATCQSFGGSCPSSCTITSSQKSAGNGISGCGGGGGGGGSFGTGGGASVAVYVWDAHVTVFGGSFTTSNGGNGGNGGNGASGGSASVGQIGAPFDCATSLSNPTCGGNFCTGFFNSGVTLDGGAAGGSGGTGGVGGHGGGGSGGPSYAVVQGGAGAVTLNGNPVLAHGAGGAGGDAGGATGVAADRFP